MKISLLDTIAGALVALILLGPLTAGMLGTRYASTETRVKSEAPGEPTTSPKK